MGLRLLAVFLVGLFLSSEVPAKDEAPAKAEEHEKPIQGNTSHGTEGEIEEEIAEGVGTEPHTEQPHPEEESVRKKQTDHKSSKNSGSGLYWFTGVLFLLLVVIFVLT